MEKEKSGIGRSGSWGGGGSWHKGKHHSYRILGLGVRFWVLVGGFGGWLGLGLGAILIRMAILGASFFEFSMCRVGQSWCLLISPCD